MRISFTFLAVAAVLSLTFRLQGAEDGVEALFPDGSPGRALGVTVTLDRTSHTGDRAGAEYSQGMPGVIDVRVVNLPAKRQRPAAQPIKVSKAWRRHVKFLLVTPDGKSVPLEARQSMADKARPADGEVELRRQDLRGTWIMESSTTQSLSTGLYHVVASVGPVKSRKVPMRIVAAATGAKEAAARAALRKSWVEYRDGDYKSARQGAENAMKKHGRMTCDNGNYAMIIAARCYEKMKDPGKALALYEEFVQKYKPAGPRDNCDLVRMKIADLKKRAGGR